MFLNPNMECLLDFAFNILFFVNIVHIKNCLGQSHFYLKITMLPQSNMHVAYYKIGEKNEYIRFNDSTQRAYF